MIQVSTQPAPQPQPAAGPGVATAGGDGTGFLAVFSADPPDPVAPVGGEAGAAAPPDDAPLQDPASAVAAGPVGLWLGVAMAQVPYLRPPVPDKPTLEVGVPSVQGALDSSSPPGGELALTVPDVAVGVTAVVSDRGLSAATGPMLTAVPENSAPGRMMPEGQASAVVRGAVTTVTTDGSRADPDPSAPEFSQNPNLTPPGASAEGSSVSVRGRSQSVGGADRRAAWSPVRALHAIQATGFPPTAAMTEPGGSPPDALSATQAGAVALTAVAKAGEQKLVPASAAGGEVGQLVSGPSDPRLAVDIRPGMNPDAAIAERPKVAAPLVPRGLSSARVNRLPSPFAGVDHAIFYAPMPTAPDKAGHAPPDPVTPPAAAISVAPTSGVVTAIVTAADPMGPAGMGLSRAADQAAAELPAPGIETGDPARDPGSAGAAPAAAVGSSLTSPLALANRQNHPGAPVPLARNDTTPATIGKAPESEGQPRADDGSPAALADAAAPSPVADHLAPTGEAGPALAQILAIPVAPSARASALSFPPHSRPLAAALIEHARNGGADSVELSLAPDELGRLRMSLQPEGDVMRVLLSAERPETVDLMRRHADQLAQEFRQAGYSGATLSFGQWGAGGAAHPQAQAAARANPQADATLASPAPTAPPPGAPAAPGGGGLDLRL